jgi:hypothetical protein
MCVIQEVDPLSSLMQLACKILSGEYCQLNKFNFHSLQDGHPKQHLQDFAMQFGTNDDQCDLGYVTKLFLEYHLPSLVFALQEEDGVDINPIGR